MKIPRTAAQAHKAKLRAQQLKNCADSSLSDLIQATEMEKIADQFIGSKSPTFCGTGGELLPPDTRALFGLELAIKNPDMVSIEASIQRIDLADQAGAFEMALDVAESVKANNPVEQMLSHQMAASHKAAMTLLARSLEVTDCVHQTHLIKTAARIMDTYQRAVLILSRVKSESPCHMTVQHVQVSRGGQAVVTGAIVSKSKGES